jgi:acetyl esterase/lipase
MNQSLNGLTLLIVFGASLANAGLHQTTQPKTLAEGAIQQRVESGDSQAAQSRRSMREIVMMPVVYRIPGMDKVKIQKDLKYTSANNPNLKMDVYIPPGLAKSERRPAVIFIHGGAGAENTPKDWGFYISWGRLIAASGMVGATFTHRLGFPSPAPSEAAQDVTDAINYVRDNADSLNIDRDRICLAAYSAGGPMLSLAMRESLPYVRCLVAFYAFMDIQQSEPYMKSETAEMVKSFSPIVHLAKNAGGIPPIFIARAGRDTVPTMNDSIDRFIHEAVSRNITIDFANHPQGVHSFDSQNDDERSREIIRRAIDFMKFHLGVVD